MKNKINIISFMFFLLLTGSAIAGFFGPKDKQAPIIKLNAQVTPDIVFMDKIVIDGQVEDENMIESLKINHIPVMYEIGNNIFFSYIAKLNVGENVLTIQAVDEAGNSAEKTIHITRKLPSQIQLSERLSIAVLPFKHEKIMPDAVSGFQDSLINALTKRNRFQIIERNQIDTILQEQQLSRTRLFDSQTASKLGRLVSARSVITGSIINSDNRIIITAQMIDVETSEVISQQEIWGGLNDPLSAGEMAEGLALKFHQGFPLVDGHIIEKQGGSIVVDIGQHVIKPDRRLIIFRGEPVIHPVTGENVGLDIQVLGHALVIQVQQKTAIARLIDCDEATLNLTDRVITE
ncbi:MAG: hypothetical protein DRH93_18030 [Deltaproteobacteria bacterium]|nr:MAG: hypothetical protein DRH93_18030 [Deltaproteobacteria bacterium]